MMKLAKRSKRTGHKAVKLGHSTIVTSTEQEKSIMMIQRAIKDNHVAIIIEYKRGSGFVTREICGRKEFDKVLYDIKYHYDSNLYSEHIDDLRIDNLHTIISFDTITDKTIKKALGEF